MTKIFQTCSKLETLHYSPHGVTKEILEGAFVHLNMKTIGLGNLSILPLAIDRFPNLEHLRIVAWDSFQNGDLFSELSRLPTLQHLWLGMRIQSNVTLFNVLRSCTKLQSLRIRCVSVTARDLNLLADVAPGLKNLDLSTKVFDHFSAGAYAKLVCSLSQVEALAYLPTGVLSRVTHPLQTLQSLTLSYPATEDVLALNTRCPNINKLVIFLIEYSSAFCNFSLNTTSLEELTVVGGIAAALPCGSFPHVKKFSAVLSHDLKFTANDFLSELWQRFPNLTNLCVSCTDMVSEATVNLLCRKLRSLTQLIIKVKFTRRYHHLLKFSEISSRARMQVLIDD